MTDPIDLGPLPEPPAFYRYQFQSHYGPVWRSSAENWNGCPPRASEGLYSADQLRAERQRAYALGREHERAEEAASRDMMRDILNRVAVALKREPGPLESHDWSDLPELAARAAAQGEPADCADNDSPWLTCKPCAAAGKCAMRAAPPADPAPGVVEALIAAIRRAIKTLDRDGDEWGVAADLRTAVHAAALAAAQKEQSKP